jgi:hypothetical protein
VWVARVARGVVVEILHPNLGTRWQADRLRVPVDALPIEIPVADVEQRALGAVGQVGEALHFPRKVVRVRLHRVDIDRHRELHGVDNGIAGLPCGDVEVLAREAHERRLTRRRAIREVQAERALHHLPLPARAQVHQIRQARLKVA